MHLFRACAVLALLSGCAADPEIVLVVGGSGAPDEGSPSSQPDPPAEAAAGSAHERCAWIGQDSYAKGVATYLAHADHFTAIHPKWFELSPDGSIRTFANADDAVLTDAAAANGTLLIPMIANRGVGPLRAMLADPAARRAHAAALVALAVDRGYDGLDIDYEHLWSPGDRAGYEAFIADLAGGLHAAGKQLSVAVPGLVAPHPRAAYDYPFLARTADAVHLMGYDFHTVGTHAGPVAPIGWVEAVASYAASVDAGRFVLALPNYGVTTSWYGDSEASVRACAGAVQMTTDHMASCSYGHYDAGHAPNCVDASGQTLFFDDLESLAAKVAVARDHGLAGVSYWTLGGEPDGFFSMVRAAYR